MIDFNQETQTFNIVLRNSYYAFFIDAHGRLVHLGWGQLPPTDRGGARLRGNLEYEAYVTPLSFVTQHRPDELLAFGEVVSHQTTLKVSFATLPQALQAHEQPHLPIRDLRLHYAWHKIVNDAQPGLAAAHGQPTGDSSPRETLQVRLQDPVQPFTVDLFYRITPELDIIERWLALENHGEQSVTVEECNFATLHLPNGRQELTYVSGAWAREFQTQRSELVHGSQIIESRALQTGHYTNPFFMLNRPRQGSDASGIIYFGALAYSGSWRITFERLPSWQVRVHAGYNGFDFALELAPGERHVTPALVSGVAHDGWGGASRRLHRFARERVLPQPAKPRPVLFNSWEATYFDISHENQVRLAQLAAAIGVELFCVDDGWFGGRSSDRAGLGDWIVRKEVFPDGLGPLATEVNRLGMQFGLWIEPEMINSDSDLYRSHPDWVLHFPGRPRSEARNQLILDFGRDEVVEHIYSALDALLRHYPIRFFKWDMNRYTSEPGSAAGKAIWRRHVAGVYSIIDRLRRSYPNLDVQSCSGGGGRIDLGIMARTDQVWVSDQTDAFDRIAIQEGFSLAYPARTMEAWVSHVPNDINLRVAPLNLRFDVAMRGALGIGVNLTKLQQSELDEYAKYIRFYKQIRHIVQQGDLYRLQRLEDHGVSLILYVLPDGSEAVYSLAIERWEVGSYRPQAPLRGLNSNANYAIYDRDDNLLYELSGFELMTLGIPRVMRESVGYSRTLHLRQKR